MKSLILISFLTLSLALTSNYQVQAQTVTETSVQTELDADQILNAPPVEKTGFFKNIWDKLNSEALYGIIGLIGGFFAKKGWITTIKKWLGYGVTVTQSLSHLLDKTSNGLSVLNNAIQDNGKLKENSLREIMEAKKEFTVELNDALITIKPKAKA